MVESQLRVHDVQDAVVVGFRGESILDSLVIDSIARQLYALVDEKTAAKLVLDFSGVKFIASQAVGVLITLKQKADAAAGQMAICSMCDEIRRVFKIMNLEPMFNFFDDETAALEAMEPNTL